MSLQVLFVVFAGGLAVACVALIAEIALVLVAPGRRLRGLALVASAVLAALGSLAYGLGGAYPGTGPPWVLGLLVAVAAAALALVPVAAARRLPARTVAMAPVAALVLLLLDAQLLIDRPPLSGQVATLIVVAAAAWLLLAPRFPLPRRSQRVVAGVVVLALAVGGYVWRSADSRHPGSFSLGGSSATGAAAMAGHTMSGHTMGGGRSVTALVAAPAASGPVHRYTVRALQDGDRLRYEPAELRFTQGERAVVTVRNETREATAVHWHGMEVPNSQDGVPGLTQDAIKPGGTFIYTFDAEDAGTYWFHAHQDAVRQIPRGLAGAVVVTPASTAPAGVDRALLLRLGDLGVTVTDPAGAARADAAPGTPVRLRVINTDELQHDVVLGTPFRVASLDGHDLAGGGELRAGTAVTVPAGGRADLVYTQPASGPAVLGAGPATFTTGAGTGGVPATTGTFDPDAYGTRSPDPVRDASRFDVDQTVSITSKLGFYDGGLAFSAYIDDRLYPDGRMIMVHDGDLVRLRLENRSFLIHPMHLHGQTLTVLEHNGKTVTGAVQRLDSLQLGLGETYVVAFKADNPGLWMFHCHNLQHAVNGMDLMLGYDGVTTPYRAGADTGNTPQ